LRITRRWLWIAVAFNIVGIPLLFLFFMRNVIDSPWEIWPAFFIMAAFCAGAAIISLLVVVIIPVAFASSVRNTAHELPIYFFGQLLVPMALGAYISYITVEQKVRNENLDIAAANFVFVRESIGPQYDIYDTFRLKAFYQLESTFTSERDLIIQEWYTVKKDTAIDYIVDTALYVDFLYTTRAEEGWFTSRHVIHPTGDTMLFSGIPLEQNKELIERIKAKRREFQKLQELTGEDTKDFQLLQDAFTTYKRHPSSTAHPLK
jgi:hypothetical protein